MMDFPPDFVIILLSIILFIALIAFTVYLILNEKKLKKTKPLQELKKMYKEAMYVSIGFIFIGIIISFPAICTGEHGLAQHLGGSISSAGFVAFIYSFLPYYTISRKRH